MPRKHKQEAISTKKAPRRLWMIDVAVGLATIGLIGLSIWYNTNRQRSAAYAGCDQTVVEHRASVQANRFTPDRLAVARCDRIIISNLGQQTYDLSFGQHDNLVAYPGFSRQTLRPGEYFELDALKSGQHTLHDHTGNQAYLELSISD